MIAIQAYPKCIDIELNTDCNLHCDMCPYHETHKDPEHMDLTLYKQIIEEIATWEDKPSIKLCQRGEPLLSPILFDAIGLAAQHGLDTSINTNGILLSEFAGRLARSSLTTLYLSDYGIKAQFKNAIVFKACQNIFKSKTKFIIKTSDTERKWKALTPHIIKPKYYEYNDPPFDITPLPYFKCDQIFNRMIIEPSGKVRECCGNIHKDKYIGDVREQPLLDVWTSNPHKRYCNLHKSGLSHMVNMCTSCPVRYKAVDNK